MVDDLMSQVKEKYLDLRALSPNHELLRYFVLTETREFDLEHAVEFSQRFNKSNILKRWKQGKERIPFSEYRQMLVQETFGNYLSSLDAAISEMIS